MSRNKFQLKTFINKLPTLEEMKLRYPESYKSAKCFKCSYNIETNTHVFICPTRRSYAIAKISNSISSILTEYIPAKVAIKITNKYICPSNLF